MSAPPEERKRVALPIAPGEDTPLRRSVREGAFGVLDSTGPAGAVLATQWMEDVLDATLAHTLSSGPPAACARGCMWCCHVYVTVMGAEAIVAIQWANANLSPDELDALRLRLRANAERARGVTPGDYPRQTCAFIVDGACSIHPARPAHCRSAHSVDVTACIAAYEARPAENLTIPGRAAVRRQANEVRVGYKEALAHAKMDRTPYELQQVAHILLEDAEAAERWLSGDTASLDAARQPPVFATLTQPR
jgi:Fe-S-cluster containining protein